MSSNGSIKNAILSAVIVLAAAAAITAQSAVPVETKAATPSRSEAVVPAASPTPVVGGVDVDQDDSAEARAIMPVYNNFLKEYRLGPNDVITIEVFGQCPDYCKSAISVPPTARISYPLIREGVMVGGKTVEEVAAEVTKKLDEYIIDPKVTVTLDKAMSARYSVLGKVNAPGVRVLDRKVSVYEAIVESGGVAKDADKKKVVIYSYNGGGRVTSKMINLTELEQGKADMVFLSPGDQVFVSGKGFTLSKVLDVISRLTAFRGIVTGGLPY
ncbi:MAG: polysaccharide biosynthesis/export family protein [Acidobacteriota bacterium]